MQRWLLLISVGLIACSSSAGQTGELHMVIKIKDQRSTGARTILVTLASGRQIEIPVQDIDPVLTRAVNAAQSQSSASPTPTAQSDPPTDDAAASVIRGKCARDWPDNFQMRAYCEKQQREGLSKLRGRSVGSGDMRTIRNKCAKDWPADFKMRDYCEEQQVKALESLRGR